MIYTADEQNLIVLSAMENMTYNERYVSLSALMSFEPDFALCKDLLIKRGGIGVYNKVREFYLNADFRKKIFSELEKRQVECVTIASEDYPELLRHIPEPPIALYIKGRRELLKTRCFSIVGSRRSPTQSLAECRKFAKELSKHFTVVSGSATGADCAALEGAEGRAISVIAHGFDHLSISAQALKEVQSEGLFISEHFPTVAPQSFLFPVRNRIIAGISEGTLIVSAANRSGALITAHNAADYGREVFAFPYSIGVTAGEGCNNLIKEGANLCQNPLDILEVFGLDLKPSPEIALTEDERVAYEAIKESGDIYLPVLAEKLGAPPYKLLPVLSALEIKGLIIRLGGNRYSII